ncbi:uncharacterized protein [Palaemon carinicauda]|uniref:uncharacterized protein n=1 Tax=Palaemon carinicauda TaxID=392227 RepID=UPI0035B65584
MDCDSSLFTSHYGELRRRKKRPFRIHQNKVQNESDPICRTRNSALPMGSSSKVSSFKGSPSKGSLSNGSPSTRSPFKCSPSKGSPLNGLPPPVCETGATLLDEEGFPLWKLDDSLTDEEGYPALSLQSSISQGRPTALSEAGWDGEGFPTATEHSLTIPWRPRSSYRELSSYSYPCDRHVDLESGERTVRKVSPVRRLQNSALGSVPEFYSGANGAGTRRGANIGTVDLVSSFSKLLNNNYKPWFGEMDVRMSRRDPDGDALGNT